MMVRLRPKGEPITFCCSHRCLLTEVMVVRGESVLIAPARPVRTRSEVVSTFQAIGTVPHFPQEDSAKAHAKA
jgi:hypothetical protein